jgi:predicted secreted protein
MNNRKYISVIVLFLLASCLGSQPNHEKDEKRNPVIAIGIDNAESTVSIRDGQDFEVRLPVIPGTGYGWFIVRSDVERVRSIGQSVFQKIPGTGTVGGAELQVFHFKALQKGLTELVFEERRPWEKASKRSFAVMLSID